MVDTADVGEVEQLLLQSGAPSRIETGGRGADGRDGRFGFFAEVQTDGELSLTRYRSSGQWALHSDSDLYAVTVATTPTLRWSRGDGRGDFVGAPVLLPPGTSSAHIDGDTDMFEVRLPESGVGRIAAELRGVEAVRLGSGTRRPRTPEHAELLAEVVRTTRRLFEGDLLHDDRLLVSLKANLVAAMVEGYALAEGALEWRLPSTGARIYRRAREALEGATLPVTATDVARAAGVPLLMLDRLFRSQTGEGVADAVLTARVRGASAQLMRTEPSRAAPDAVVRFWGFPSLAVYLHLHRRRHPGRLLPFELG